MLAEIKTEAARHFGFILRILCFKTLLFSSGLFCLPFPFLLLPSLLSRSLSHCSLPLPVFDAHTLSHFIDSPLSSVLTLTPSGASARARSLSAEF